MKNLFGGKVEEKFEKVPLLASEKPSKRHASYLENHQDLYVEAKDKSKRKKKSSSKSSSKGSSKKNKGNDNSQIKPLTEKQFEDLE